MERFLIPWNAGKFSPAQQEIIYNASNGEILKKKRLKAFPDFSNYLNALIGFSQSSQSTQSSDKLRCGN